MKHFNRYSLGMLPLLSILAMSPSVMETQFSGRGIASVEIEKVELEQPKLEIEKIKPDIKPIHVVLEEEDKFEIELEKIEIPKQKIVVDKVKPEILPIKAELKSVIEKEKIELDSKIAVDDIKQEISPIEVGDLLVVEKEEIKPDSKIIVDKIKPEIKPMKIGDLKLDKSNKKGKIERKGSKPVDEEVCEQDEKVKALSSQVEQLIASQNQIMQSMMNMSQMMMMQSMMMQQQMMMSQFNSMGTQKSPYEYASQTTAGNWVYYPSGFQPQQQNIFAQQAPQQPLAQQSVYPSHALQPSSWEMKPGTFGMFDLSNVGHNMGSQSQVPVGMSQAQLPVQPQIAGTMPTTGPIM